RAHMSLKDYPDLATWLLSLLDHVLSQQAPAGGIRPLAEPPGGDTRQRLIDSGILFMRPRPDGRMALGIQPELSVQLMLIARRHGEPAYNAMLDLTEDPELVRWLLMQYAPGAAPARDPARFNPALRESMRRHHVLVEELPAPDAFFPDPDAPVDLAAELAPAARLIPQPAGQPIPAEVRRVLGRHTPALPPGVDLVWGVDAGTGMVYPTRVPASERQRDLHALAGSAAPARTAQWEAQRQAARASVREHRHAILRDIVPEPHRSKLRHYVRQLRERGYFPPLDDGQVKLRASIHNQPTIASLHNGLAGIVNTINGEKVIPSYCYLSCYEEHSVLDRHLDRAQCVYNVCVVIDMQYLDRDGDPEPWPIYLELDGQPQEALLRVGDGVFFSGNSIYHWRNALPAGQRAVVCFNHFVPIGFPSSLD
ncbi:MAG: hypothetical protein L6Q83_03710, partial [Gammaproteobacteria bacterium]|nr:hypothetical protein [Gammaproteobacteria bacterium]